MNKNSPNTEEILDAIKNMMSEKSVHQDEGLPKDVIELTNPIDEEVKKDAKRWSDENDAQLKKINYFLLSLNLKELLELELVLDKTYLHFVKLPSR